MFNYTQLEDDKVDYYPIIDVEELPDGQQIFFSIEEKSLVMFNIDGNYYTIADECTHDHGPIGEGEVVGTEIKCPRHGAKFSLIDGKALSMPAFVDIAAYPVRIKDGKVEVGLPKK
jgi:3-phenylpropionate/trans-cinnamate dioxygenase ferredoxin component